MKHFLELADVTPAELAAILDESAALKAALAAGEPHEHFPGRTLGMLFEKPSTRTRISFETGMTHFGGHAINFGPEQTQLGRGEPLSDTARVLSRYVDFLLARVNSHDDLETLAEHATVPVVNGLSDRAHPVQTLADLLTIRETFGDDDISVAWIGDGNNVARSFAIGCAMAGVDLTVATPEGYGIDDDALALADEHGGVETTTDPVAAVSGADAVATDVWVSMGQEAEREAKLAAFEGYQLNEELLSHAPDARVMHCLPAHRGEEITADVLEGGRSLAWDQAENRMHTSKALLRHLADAADEDARQPASNSA